MTGGAAPPPPSPRVVVYGTVCLDRFVAVGEDGEPLPGEASPQRLLPGGEAFNTATALAGWGVPVALTGTALGNDPEADPLRSLLDDAALGLPRTLVPDMPGAVTPVCTVRVFPDGERKMGGRGFDRAVAPPPLPPSVLTARPLFAVDPNLRQPAVDAAVTAAQAGCPVVAMDFAHVPSVVGICRLLVTSRDVLRREYGDAFDAEAVAKRLVMEGGAFTAIVTLGADGCVVYDREEGLFHEPALPVRAVDTTGAGDTFRAGLCYGLLQQDWPLRRTVRFASAAAALHCTVWGGGSRIPLARVLEAAGNS